DLVFRLGDAQLTAQVGDLRNIQPFVVDQDRAVRPLERRLELLQLGLFVCSRDCHLSETSAGLRLDALARPAARSRARFSSPPAKPLAPIALPVSASPPRRCSSCRCARPDPSSTTA